MLITLAFSALLQNHGPLNHTYMAHCSSEILKFKQNRKILSDEIHYSINLNPLCTTCNLVTTSRRLAALVTFCVLAGCTWRIIRSEPSDQSRWSPSPGCELPVVHNSVGTGTYFLVQVGHRADPACLLGGHWVGTKQLPRYLGTCQVPIGAWAFCIELSGIGQ